jgi:hypothetical protein
MTGIFADGGFFIYIVTLLGIVTLTLNVVQLVRRDKNFMALIVGLISATFFLGLCGTGAGLYMAAQAFEVIPSEEAIPDRFVKIAENPAIYVGMAMGIAATTTAMGSFWAALNSIVAGIAQSLRN